MKKIGIITSGGDSPGMNACLRAAVRTALSENIQVIGFFHGYEGLIDNDYIELTSDKVANIIHRGGTILKTARSKRFMTDEGMKQAVQTLNAHLLDGLIVIGGDGSFKGALELSKHHHVKTIGCPGTIDNDLSGTDFTIGYDTATNTVLHAIDAIRDTASSHNRLFFIEVMGRDSGFIALRSGLAAGVETILIPEMEMSIDELVQRLERNKKKSSSLIIVAE
jgi:6-phosphofructokinase 1